MGYLASLPGRAFLAAAGCFLLGPGLASVLESQGPSIRVLAIFPMLGVAACIVSVGFGMFPYPRQTVAWLLWLPPLLWTSFTGAGVMVQERWGLGVGVMLVAIGLLIAAARPATGAKAGEFT